jgi:hypothetical protein
MQGCQIYSMAASRKGVHLRCTPVARRKGFVHIIEMLLMIVALLVMITYFSYVPASVSQWDSVRLSVMASDLLFTLDAAGVDWFNATDVGRSLGTYAPANLAYSVELDNAAKPLMRVGCVCSEPEFAAVSAALSPFTINGRPVSFNVTRIDPANPVFSTYYDTIVVMDYALAPHEADVRKFLSYDRGLLEIRDIDAPSKADALHQDLFGLSWDASAVTTEDPVGIVNLPPESLFYAVSKYFLHIPNATGQTIPAGYAFPDFLEPEEKLNASGKGVGTLLVQQGAFGAVACTARVGVQSGTGRAAWLSAGPASDERDILMKSLVIWLSGERYGIIESPMRNPASSTILLVADQDMYEVVRVVLKLGYIY